MSDELYTRVLVASGPLVAIFRSQDSDHERCVEALARIVPPLLTSWPVITEAAYLLRNSSPAVDKLLSGPRVGLYRILPLDEGDLPALEGLLRKYRKLGAQLADISLVYLAAREGFTTVLTLDRRDVSVFRGPKNQAFRLLPPN